MPRPGEEEFRRGWERLRTGDAGAAAVAFDLARQRAVAGSLREDATFWRAIALDRAGATGALAALEEFLSEFPDSYRGAQAALVAAPRALAAGHVTRARALLELAALRGRGDTAARARAALADLDRR